MATAFEAFKVVSGWREAQVEASKSDEAVAVSVTIAQLYGEAMEKTEVKQGLEALAQLAVCPRPSSCVN